MFYKYKYLITYVDFRAAWYYCKRNVATKGKIKFNNLILHRIHLWYSSPNRFFTTIPLHNPRGCIKNLKIKIYKNVFLPFVLYECGTWSLILWEEHRLRILEKRMLRKIFGPKERTIDHGENCIMKNFIAGILHRILSVWLNQEELCGMGMWHAWGRDTCLRGFDWEARRQETTGKT
jgi:hypothetical protein